MSILRDIFEGFRRGSVQAVDPFRVQEVKAEDYICWIVVCREDSLVLYKNIDEVTLKLEILLQVHINHATNMAFSLLRTEDETEAQIIFFQMREKLPLLVECVPEIGISRQTLQNVSIAIRENPLWTLAHLAAHFGYIECFKNNIVLSMVNETCLETLQTPLHIAVKSQQITSVTTLIGLDVRMDIVDFIGDSVFHYAAITTKEMIQALATTQCDAVINILNNDGHSPLHLACMADKPECIKELLKAGADVNAASIIDGPVENQDYDMEAAPPSRPIKEVIDMYSHQFSISDMKNGGTPLHWSKTPELTEALQEHGCHVDARNFQGDTALHLMFLRNKISCAVTLLSHHANVDVQGADGNTPLHLAVKAADISLVYTVIAFGANVNMLNNRGETARHIIATEKKNGFREIIYALHIVGAERCAKRLPSCSEGCELGGQFNGIPPEKSPLTKSMNLYDELIAVSTAITSLTRNKPTNSFPNGSSGDTVDFVQRKCRVLSLDGGGIRGLVLIQMLDHLEKMLDMPITQCFDWLAGTSTGGVLALVLASGRLAKYCRCLYFRLKDKVFVGARPYDAEALETILKNALGETTVMSDITHPRVMVTATKADRHPADLHIFRNYESPLEILDQEEKDNFYSTPLPKPQDQLIWQAARATGAAPTYFRASGQFLDGGLIANNPTLDVLTEIHQCNQALIAAGHKDQTVEVSVILSLGTGRSPVVPVSTIDVFRPDTLWGACKMALGVTALGQLLVDQATQTDGRVIVRTQAICNMIGIPYFRLNPQLTENVALDETDTKILVKMLWETTAYMHSMKEELETLVCLLKS